ncbi:hypothetical protein E7T09_04440 [Deinococcus sp. KSM4-11]|uniref:hypothetical protein n=1 Tax=Deinococcus sp. KSM4-11 TaxID=2568654 RepID=UPI0010A41979|nr:hypothetical protein [Deinococcus sp. KSM4-11]THF88459.1 hypothetical protein E7T09_04440 [Deinococcus sp. KSM4-11]
MHHDVELHGRLAGRIEWQLLNQDGSVAQSGHQPNMIVDRGMNIFGTNANHLNTGSGSHFGDWRNYLCVGTGSTAPAVTQSALVAEVMRGSADAGISPTNTVAVAAGVATGSFTQTRILNISASYNLTEFGLSDVSTAGGLLCIRELFRDGGGNPISLSVQAGQQLQLTHTLDITLTYGSGVASQFDLTGVGTLQGSATWFSGSGATNIIDMFTRGFNPGQTTIWHGRPLDGANTGAPDVVGGSFSGTSDTISSTPTTYVAGSFERIRTVVWDTGVANYAHYGWMFGYVYSFPYSGYKFVLSNPATMTKTSANRLTLNMKTTWGRAA